MAHLSLRRLVSQWPLRASVLGSSILIVMTAQSCKHIWRNSRSRSSRVHIIRLSFHGTALFWIIWKDVRKAGFCAHDRQWQDRGWISKTCYQFELCIVTVQSQRWRAMSSCIVILKQSLHIPCIERVSLSCPNPGSFDQDYVDSGELYARISIPRLSKTSKLDLFTIFKIRNLKKHWRVYPANCSRTLKQPVSCWRRT